MKPIAQSENIENIISKDSIYVDKTEYMKLINFVTKTDPDAFVTIYAVNEMMYKPKPKS